MRSQIVTSSQQKRHTDLNPYAFTEQGVAMLSSVLHSDRAVQMNIAIMRAFVEMRKVSQNLQILDHYTASGQTWACTYSDLRIIY
ncbi:MAG TPA: ORF6N domain-containing protein [Flavitalea sp.]|nr:ORF6N domain-containing protein [Flavitalea sp.]